MLYEIKRINSWSVIKIIFLISFITGALIGVFYSLFFKIICSMLQDFAFNDTGVGISSFSEIGLFFSITFFALFISMFNCFLCMVILFIYNYIAQLIGGFEIELESQ